MSSFSNQISRALTARANQKQASFPGYISAQEAEMLLKQAGIGSAVIGKPLKWLAQKTMGEIGHGWGWAANKLGRGVGALAKPSIGAGAEGLAHAAEGAAAHTPWSETLANWGQKTMDWGQHHINAANTGMRSVGAAPGATGLQRFGGWTMRTLGGAHNVPGWKGTALNMASVPFAAAWGYTPGSWAFDKALEAPGQVRNFAAGQQMEGAGRAAAEYANQPFLQRIGAAFSPDSIGQSLSEYSDPRAFQAFQQYRQY